MDSFGLVQTIDDSAHADIIVDEYDDYEAASSQKNFIHLPPSISILLFTLMLTLGQIDSASAQDYLVPDSIENCSYYGEGTVINFSESGFVVVEDLPIRIFEEVEPGIVQLSDEFMASTPSMWASYDFVHPDFYLKGRESLSYSLPIIDIYLRHAFEKVDGLTYRDAAFDGRKINNIPDDVNIVYLFTVLGMSLPGDVAAEAFQGTILELEKGNEIGFDTNHEIRQLNEAKMNFNQYNLNRQDPKQIDIVTYLEQQEAILSHEANWDALKQYVPLSNDIWNFLQDVGYSLTIEPKSKMPEGYGGFVIGKNIVVTYDDNTDVIHLEIIHHEIGHAIQNVLRNELNGYWNYTDSKGVIHDNFDLAFAYEILYLLDGNADQYPLFAELMVNVMYGNAIKDPELSSRFSRNDGYTDILAGQRNLIYKPEELVNMSFESRSGAGRSVIRESFATMFERILKICSIGNADIISNGIFNLLNQRLIEEAINDSNAAQQEP